MRTYKTEGIIIKRRNIGEADRILTIFTKHYGKIKAVAKGVRKIKSRRAPHLELFNHVSLLLFRGKDLDIITEAQVINSFSNLRKDLEKVGLTFKVCELVDQLTREGVSQKEVFSLLSSCLVRIDHPKEMAIGLGRVIRDFEIQLLQLLGFLPKGKALEKVDISRFIEGIIEKKLKSRRFLSQV